MVKLVISTSNFQSQVADLLPCNNCKKSRLTYGMIRAYDLLKSFDVVLKNPMCRREDLVRFHSREYIDTITNEKFNRRLPFENDREARWREVNEVAARWYEANGKESYSPFENWAQLYQYFKEMEPICEVGDSQSVRKRTIDDAFSEDNELVDDLKRFGLEGDCPVFSYLPMYIQVVTGATLSLAPFFKRSLDTDYESERVIAINWDGGRHHAARQNASGFCYVNDIVLLIQELRKHGFKRISYVDFDLHHGDGVENAFRYSNFIQTISVHLFEAGFFPGTGGLNPHSGKLTTKTTTNDKLVNVPLSHGLDDNYLRGVVRELVLPLMRRHQPEVIVVQCGGDGLNGDKYGEWQLTVRGLADIIIEIIEAFPKESFALLGGGGYNEVLMSRFYTHLTRRIVTRYGSKEVPFKDVSGGDRNSNDSNNSDDDNDDDSLILEHEYIEFYTDEHHKTWIYDQEGSSRCRHLINDNKPEFIEELKEYYGV